MVESLPTAIASVLCAEHMILFRRHNAAFSMPVPCLLTFSAKQRRQRPIFKREPDVLYILKYIYLANIIMMIHIFVIVSFRPHRVYRIFKRIRLNFLYEYSLARDTTCCCRILLSDRKLFLFVLCHPYTADSALTSVERLGRWLCI